MLGGWSRWYRVSESWFDQLTRFYKEIVENPDIPAGNLDKANEIICRCIEELRPLIKTYLVG